MDHRILFTTPQINAVHGSSQDRRIYLLHPPKFSYWHSPRLHTVLFHHSHPRSVNADVVGSWFSSFVTTGTPSSCIWITTFRPLLRKSMQFCKSTTVTTVVLTHYVKLNTIRTISCSIKTDNNCSVQIYWFATYKITDTKESSKQRTLLLQNII
jgi:hypothetical protein